MDNKQKVRILKIIDILKRETDEFHQISTNDLILRLEEYGISSNRKTIYDDICVISDYYGEIIKTKGTKMYYYFNDRVFDPSELKIIMSAISSAGFLTEAKRKDLIDKLSTLTSDYIKDELTHDIKLHDNNQKPNERVLYNISSLMEAINKNCKVVFHYFHYNFSKNIVKNEQPVLISPIDLVYNDNFYYLVGAFDDYGAKRVYRIDKMLDVVPLYDEPRVKFKYDQNEYKKKLFNMFSGNECRVDLKIHISIIDPIIDKFKDTVLITPIDEEYAKINVLVNASKTFYSYVFSFGGLMEIIGPERIKEEYREKLLEEANKYNK